ncbi:MAG: amino acid ABC transporter substrate-binding protein [Desulfobacterales bacterium]|nr:amino acid ABC transporter substrate-binding protein [Desulfobacterales bacterium]
MNRRPGPRNSRGCLVTPAAAFLESKKIKNRNESMGKRGKMMVMGACTAIVIILIFGRELVFRSDLPSRFEPPPVPTAEDQVITVHYHERRPYYITTGEGVTGLCADPARLAFEKAGIPYRWRQTPPKRQMVILKQNQGKDCLLGWFKNPAREKIARYSPPIYRDKPTLALARADNPRVQSGGILKALLSNPDLLLLKKDGYSYGAYVDALLEENKPRWEATAASNVGMLNMIHSGRADYFFISEEEADELIDVSGFPDADFKYIRFSDMPMGEKRYILFGKQIEDEVVEKVNEAIRVHVLGANDQ